MGSLVKCFLQTTGTLFGKCYARRFINIHDLNISRQFFLSIRSFNFHQNQASLDSIHHQFSTVKEGEEGEFDAERLEKISDILNCSIEKAHKLSRKHDFLNEISLAKLQEKVHLMLSYNVPYAVIQANLRVAKHVSTEVLSQRLKLLHKLSLLNHRYAGFYLYCTKKEFDQGLSNVKEYQEALEGCADIVAYTQHRLNISESVAKNLLSTSPFMRGYSPIRLKKHFDFFHFEANVSSEYLLQNFVLFNYSSQRLRHRLEIMRRAGVNNPSLWNKFWRCTPDEFNKAFAKYIAESP